MERFPPLPPFMVYLALFCLITPPGGVHDGTDEGIAIEALLPNMLYLLTAAQCHHKIQKGGLPYQTVIKSYPVRTTYVMMPQESRIRAINELPTKIGQA